MRKAYVVLVFDKVDFSLSGAGIYSEPTPTMSFKKTSAVLYEVHAESYDTAHYLAWELVIQYCPALLRHLVWQISNPFTEADQQLLARVKEIIKGLGEVPQSRVDELEKENAVLKNKVAILKKEKENLERRIYDEDGLEKAMQRNGYGTVNKPPKRSF
jgi:hypothetical protein